jgi:plasmid replication initiation protein
MSKNNLVVQHNKIIEAKYKLSVGEQRLIKYLVSMINPEDEDFKKYRISVAKLSEILDINRKDYYAAVKFTTKKLIGNVLTLEIDGRTIQSAWLASANYLDGDGVVDLRFCPDLMPFLLQLKRHFTSYELSNIINLKHIYSIRIYELLKQYQKIGKRKFSISNFREILMINDGEYKYFKDFKRWILIPAKKEIHEKTDISFTWSEERINQICVSLEFTIISKTRGEINYSSEDKIQEINIVQTSPSNLVIESLLCLGVTRQSAEKIINNYDEARIKAAIAYTEAQQKEGKVKSAAGFLVEAIKNEYRDNKAEEKLKQEKGKKAREAKERQDKEAKKNEDLQKKQKEQAIESYLAALTPEQLEALEAEFIEAFKNDTIVVQKYRETRLNSPIVKGCFDNYVSKNKLA